MLATTGALAQSATLAEVTPLQPPANASAEKVVLPSGSCVSCTVTVWPVVVSALTVRVPAVIWMQPTDGGTWLTTASARPTSDGSSVVGVVLTQATSKSGNKNLRIRTSWRRLQSNL
jgi:uncharacterized protein YqjF (DUF2071 family)